MFSPIIRASARPLIQAGGVVIENVTKAELAALALLTVTSLANLAGKLVAEPTR